MLDPSGQSVAESRGLPRWCPAVVPGAVGSVLQCEFCATPAGGSSIGPHLPKVVCTKLPSAALQLLAWKALANAPHYQEAELLQALSSALPGSAAALQTNH